MKKTWILHQDNARPHTAKFTLEYMEKHDIAVLPHPPYSPDLAPCDYWLFPTLKKHLRGKRFESIFEIQRAVQNFFNTIPSHEFEKTILQKWEERLKLCVKNDGRYFEKDRKAESSDEED